MNLEQSAIAVVPHACLEQSAIAVVPHACLEQSAIAVVPAACLVSNIEHLPIVPHCRWTQHR